MCRNEKQSGSAFGNGAPLSDTLVDRIAAGLGRSSPNPRTEAGLAELARLASTWRLQDGLPAPDVTRLLDATPALVDETRALRRELDTIRSLLREIAPAVALMRKAVQARADDGATELQEGVTLLQSFERRLATAIGSAS